MSTPADHGRWPAVSEPRELVTAECFHFDNEGDVSDGDMLRRVAAWLDANRCTVLSVAFDIDYDGDGVHHSYKLTVEDRDA